MMRRAVTCAVLLFAGLWAFREARAETALEIVRHAIDQYERSSKVSSNYGYRQRQDTRDLDRAGVIKNRKIETWDVTLIDGSPYRLLVARNDQPLSAEEQKAEAERLRWNTDERRKQSTPDRERRIAEWQHRLERQREPVREVSEAFNFALLGEEQIAGRPVYRIDGTPKPGFKPESRFAAIFPNVKLHLWVDKADYQGARIEMEVLNSVSFGGVLVRLTKGTRLLIEQTPVDNQVWLPKQFSLTAAARIMLLKGLNRELDFTFTDYRKLQPVAPAVARAQKP